jgi:uncharacterized membrane protein
MSFLDRLKREVKRERCAVCGRWLEEKGLVPIRQIGPSLFEELKGSVPGIQIDGKLCLSDLRELRIQLIRRLFRGQKGGKELETILLGEGNDYLFSFNQEYQRELSLGERISQKITRFIGSWGFVGAFTLFVILWIFYNTQDEVEKHFDTFPFNLLNLFLSCGAAVQATLILMFQNRIVKRDRLRADEDYYTTLKAALEIRQLHAKLDAFLEKNRPSSRDRSE